MSAPRSSLINRRVAAPPRDASSASRATADGVAAPLSADQTHLRLGPTPTLGLLQDVVIQVHVRLERHDGRRVEGEEPAQQVEPGRGDAVRSVADEPARQITFEPGDDPVLYKE